MTEFQKRSSVFGRFSRLLLTISATLLASSPISAQNLVQNGGFETVHGVNNPAITRGQIDYRVTVANWSDGPGYQLNVIYHAGTGDSGGGDTIYGPGLVMWGPGNGTPNGFTATSPSGGNFLAADGVYDISAITQTITGLSPGTAYTLSFWWATAQAYEHYGETNSRWIVSLGNETHATTAIHEPTGGFSGWIKAEMGFVATNGTETLSFLADSAPLGTPAFSLLDGVSLTVGQSAVPELSTWAAMIVGLGLIGIVGRRRRATLSAGSGASR